jgi:hypothetical protein
MNMDQRTLGRWAFIIGLALAVIIGLVTDIDDWALWIMIVLALFAGYVFVSYEEQQNFILVAIALVFFREVLGELPSIGQPLTQLLTSLSIFFGAMVIAIVVRNIIRWVTPV